MKRWMLVVVAVIIAIGVGGYSYTRYQLQEQSYTTEMKTGQEALQAKNYAQAATSFTHASRTRINDAPAQRYLAQTQAYVEGEQALKNREFKAAKDAYATVKNTEHGSAVLAARSTEQLTLIKKITAQRQTYQTQYQRALELNRANEFTDSNGVVTVMLQNKALKQDYYHDIYNQVKALRQQNNASLKVVTGSTPITNSAQKATDSTSRHATDQSSRSTSTPNDNQAEQSSTTVTSDAIQGSTTTNNPAASQYSDTQIQAARSQLDAAGLRAENYSDQQIATLLDRAGSEHASVVVAAKNANASPDRIQAARAELDEAGLDGKAYSDAQIEVILQRAAAQQTSVQQAAKSLQ